MFAYPWSLTGRVVRTYANESEEEAKSFTSTTITFSSYKGMADGKPKYEAHYVDCIAFGTTAKVMENIEKGSIISVVGEPRVRAYVDDNGNAKASQQVIVSSWAYAPTKMASDEEAAPTKTSPKATPKPTPVAIPDFDEDEDSPFN